MFSKLREDGGARGRLDPTGWLRRCALGRCTRPGGRAAVFKTDETEYLGLAGSIPVHLRGP
jgi:hypothetical protein